MKTVSKLNSHNIFAAILLCIYSLSAGAKEDWLCTEQSSQRVENEIQACGVATGKDENEARLKAFDNSKAEFIRICNSSVDCKNYEITVEPKRTTCEHLNEGYKCYRMIVFTIGNYSSNSVATNANQENNQPEVTVEKESKTITMEDKPDAFKPFVYDSIKDNPKIKIGMSKRELLAAFGAPLKVEPAMFGQGVLSFMFSGKMCDDDSLCYADVKGNRVIEYREFKPIYTELLKDVSDERKPANKIRKTRATSSAPDFISDSQMEEFVSLKKSESN